MTIAVVARLAWTSTGSPLRGTDVEFNSVDVRG
jgi:hypothetical protein